jgi:hypothetical protein
MEIVVEGFELNSSAVGQFPAGLSQQCRPDYYTNYYIDTSLKGKLRGIIPLISFVVSVVVGALVRLSGINRFAECALRGLNAFWARNAGVKAVLQLAQQCSQVSGVVCEGPRGVLGQIMFQSGDRPTSRFDYGR